MNTIICEIISGGVIIALVISIPSNTNILFFFSSSLCINPLFIPKRIINGSWKLVPSPSPIVIAEVRTVLRLQMFSSSNPRFIPMKYGSTIVKYIHIPNVVPRTNKVIAMGSVLVRKCFSFSYKISL